MGKKKIYVFFFILGISAGVFFALNKVKASAPAGTPSGTSNATVFYDERWQAVKAVVTAASSGSIPRKLDFICFYGTYNGTTRDCDNVGYPLGTPTHTRTSGDRHAGRIENVGGNYTVTTYPKMVITKWKVLGHIHFE